MFPLEFLEFGYLLLPSLVVIVHPAFVGAEAFVASLPNDVLSTVGALHAVVLGVFGFS